MKIQMRSNDIFYGLTFDAPFFSFLHQTVYQAVWKERVLELNGEDDILELGTYYHCADNIHFYERHFDMSSKIISESDEQGKNYTMNIENPLFNLTKDNMILTEYGIEIPVVISIHFCHIKAKTNNGFFNKVGSFDLYILLENLYTKSAQSP